MTAVVKRGSLEDIIKELRRRIRVLETSARTASVIATTIGYASIQEEGIGLPSRTSIDFVGDGVNATDDPDNNRTIVTIDGGGAASGADTWLYEETIAYDGITGYTLAMLPIQGSVFVFLNGVAMREVVDYTIDYGTGTVTFNVALTADPPPADVAMFRYQSTGSATPPPLPPPPTLISVTPTTVAAGSNVTITAANFPADQGSWVVRLNSGDGNIGILDCAVVSWSSTSIVVTVPNAGTYFDYTGNLFAYNPDSATTTNQIPLTVTAMPVAGTSGTVASYTGGSNAAKHFTLATDAITVRRVDFDVYNNPAETVRIGFATALPADTASVLWVPGVTLGAPMFKDVAIDAHVGTQSTATAIFDDDIHLDLGVDYWLVLVNVSGGTNLGMAIGGSISTNLLWDSNISLGAGTSFGSSSPDSGIPLIRLFA